MKQFEAAWDRFAADRCSFIASGSRRKPSLGAGNTRRPYDYLARKSVPAAAAQAVRQ